MRNIYKKILSFSLTCLVLTGNRSLAEDKPVNKAELNDQPSNLDPSEDSANQHPKKEESSPEEILRKIEVENALYRANLEKKLAKEFAELRLRIERLKLEKERMALEHDIEIEKARKVHVDELRALKDHRDRLAVEVDIMQTKIAKDAEKFNYDILASQKIMQKLKLDMDIMRGTLEHKDLKEELDGYVDMNPGDFYSENPLQKDGSLVISKRKIDLNGVITPWKANYVVDTIQYFNNKNPHYPIFIVIEHSPGGSVLAGSRIIEAMYKSKAPVYVVLKGFAASMSAIITTLAKKSYAYPNAEILHHQPYTSNIGSLNVRESKEFLKQLQECNRRFLGPVAKKMKISLEELDKKFYENAANGDWLEYADNAKKLNWVDEVISEIRDVNVLKRPNPQDYTWRNYIEDYWRTGVLSEKTEVDVEVEFYLPKLGRNDFYYLYDPERKYRVII